MLFRNQWCAFKTVCRTISGYDPYTSYHFILPDFEYFKWSLIILVSNIWEEEIRKGLRGVGIWMLWEGLRGQDVNYNEDL